MFDWIAPKARRMSASLLIALYVLATLSPAFATTARSARPPCHIFVQAAVLDETGASGKASHDGSLSTTHDKSATGDSKDVASHGLHNDLACQFFCSVALPTAEADVGTSLRTANSITFAFPSDSSRSWSPGQIARPPKHPLA